MQYKHKPQQLVFKSFDSKSGLTVVEVLVAVGLLGVVALITLGLIIPLRVTRDSNVETQALAYGRSYLELVRESWLEPSNYEASPSNATINPVWPSTTGGTPDLTLPSGWIITPTATARTGALYTDANTAFSATALRGYRDTLRNVSIVIQPNNGGRAITLTTVIGRP